MLATLGQLFPSLQTMGSLVGWALIAIALLLYEREEKRLDGLLLRLWVGVNDLTKTSIRPGIIRVAARATQIAIDRVFGPRLWSLRAAWTSACLSWASMLIALSVAVDFWPAEAARFTATSGWEPSHLMIFVAVAASFLPRIHLRYAPPILWALSFAWVGYRVCAAPVGYLFFFIIIVGGVVSDLVALIVTRWVLGWVDRQRSPRRVALAIVVGALLVVGVIVGPLLTILGSLPRIASLADAVETASPGQKMLLIGLTLVPMLLSLSNLLTAMFVGFFCVFLIVALAYRPFFALLDRPLYALARWGLFQNRKLLVGIGLLFVAASNPRFANLMKNLKY
jgi:hypothetical protein